MELKAEKKSLRNLLAMDEQQFRIPPYQRPYAWKADDLVQGTAVGGLVDDRVVVDAALVAPGSVPASGGPGL